MIFLPNYMIYRKLVQHKIRNKVNIIFFCNSFMAIGWVLWSMAFELYGQHIPTFATSLSGFSKVDLSLLGFYVWILPLKVIFAKYSFKTVVLFAISGSRSGTTTDDDKSPI